MELYSKRNKNRNPRFYGYRHHDVQGRGEDNIVLVAQKTRKRLHELIKYFASTDKFIERYMLVNDENKNTYSLYSKMIVEFSSREAGYDISEYIKIDSLEFVSEKLDDSKLFDFIEILLIFSKNEYRDELVKRFNKIFKEENQQYTIHDFMIVDGEHSGIRSTVPLIKDSILKKNLENYFKNSVSDSNYEVLSKISAAILQRVCSSPISKDDTKEYVETLCESVAKKWTDKENVENLKVLLSDTIINSKKLSNQVADIRHTDQSTIPVDSPKIHKLIALKNLNLAELIILTLPERYITEQDPEELKQSYIDDYQVKTDATWTIKKKVIEEKSEIKLEDIPF